MVGKECVQEKKEYLIESDRCAVRAIWEDRREEQRETEAETGSARETKRERT